MKLYQCICGKSHAGRQHYSASSRHHCSGQCYHASGAIEVLTYGTVHERQDYIERYLRTAAAGPLFGRVPVSKRGMSAPAIDLRAWVVKLLVDADPILSKLLQSELSILVDRPWSSIGGRGRKLWALPIAPKQSVPAIDVQAWLARLQSPGGESATGPAAPYDGKPHLVVQCTCGNGVALELRSRKWRPNLVAGNTATFRNLFQLMHQKHGDVTEEFVNVLELAAA